MEDMKKRQPARGCKRVLWVSWVLGCADAFVPCASTSKSTPARCRRARASAAATVGQLLGLWGRRREDSDIHVNTLPSTIARAAGVDAGPAVVQPLKVTMAPRREDSGACGDIPWKVIGDLLFEMGASWVSVSNGRATTGNAPVGRKDEMVGSRSVPADGGMVTFVVDGGRDVRAMLETACSLSGSSDCLEVLDWEEDRLECLESWKATQSSVGFETVVIGRLRVSPVQRLQGKALPGSRDMRLLEGPGWGDGEHPSTWLCLDFLERTIQDGSVREVIDYGTGSGVLATAAALLGADHVTAVDLDSEILAHAGQNFLINGVGKKVTALHTRDVSAGDLAAEVVVANMMAGPMLSQMAVLVLAVNEGGVMCLSGLRPGDVPKIKREFGKYLEWDGEFESAKDASPWGEYVRLVGRPKPGLREGGATRMSLEEDLSEMAIA